MMRRAHFTAIAATLALLWSADAAADARRVAGGERWVVERTTTLDELDVASGADISAPSGRVLTLTVNGVGTPIQPGRYRGDIVLTPTEDIPVRFGVTPGAEERLYHFRAAVYVDSGAVDHDRSVLSATRGGVADNVASGVTIRSNEENFNGMIVTGDGAYTIDRPNIDLAGNGGNDFAGYGAAIMTAGRARVTINRPTIRTRGAVRTAVWVGGDSVVTVNDADIESRDGNLPEGYRFSIVPGEMMEVPYGLGISGNVRATNLMDRGSVTYNSSRIRSQGWGALSSDGDGPSHMVVRDSVVETIEDGYGAYANGAAHALFDHTVFRVHDYGLIMTGPSEARFTNRSQVSSRKIGVMMHQGMGAPASLTVEGGTVFRTRQTAIQIKGRGANVLVDGATLRPGNGILLQTMDNDDPIMRAMMAGGPGAPPASPSGADSPPAPPSDDVTATFRNTSLRGDVLDAMSGPGVMRVVLERTALAGAISTASAAPASGQAPTQETYETIGEVSNSLQPVDTGGIELTVDAGSIWTVTRTSYLNRLVIAPGAVLTAARGRDLTLRVNGADTPIGAGAYSGAIVLEVR